MVAVVLILINLFGCQDKLMKLFDWKEGVYKFSAQLNMGSFLFKGESIKNEGETYWFMNNNLSNCYNK